MDTADGICVVTHPLAGAGENATRTLLDILSAIAPVCLVTADLPADSTVRDDHEVVELTDKGAGASILVAAVRFVINQLRMCRVLAERDEEVVLFFGATSYLLPVCFARLLGKRVLVEPRGDVPLTLRLHWEQRVPASLARALAGTVWLLERTCFALADGVVTYTPNMARQLGLDPDAPDVYPDGARYVDTERFSVEIPYDEREMVVGFLGRLDEEKGIRTLAEVAKRLPDDVTFRFIGDGDLFDWLERELADEVRAGRVELTGWVDHGDVPRELNELRLLVMPSQPTEGLPTTILEAMACGTPVYATPVSGVPDVVREGETGFLMQEMSAGSVTEDVVRLLGRDDLAASAEQARELILAEYTREAAVERYREILRA
ncbi:glycosyl transferase family 1 [Salinigranum rubrum]|uniref:Glycosyl transferase family 1 n=1 Tax=Salinigranum rubrum TaxID=755307 RepID=A0A2I8VIQ4_9EURY|nr:glycosyltransferase [Salinigranum rubrum]AUV81823.1 glycosyl transferase family 1 [Salinigranum rubrum]